MKYTVITTFHQAGLEQYGQRMIDTFEALWPADVALVIYAENCQPRTIRPNTTVINLLEVSADLRVFIDRHRDNPLAHGRAGPPEVFDPKKQFRWDAVRFSYKVFSVAHAAEHLSTDWMIWIDADTHTHTPVPMSAFDELCPATAGLSYLGRGEKYHSECGWVGYNLNDPDCKKFIQEFVNMYKQDDIFKLSEWHDSYVWDQVRKRSSPAIFHNLNRYMHAKNLSGHPFINSALGNYMDHAKGNRKKYGHSLSTDIQQHQDHPYWKQILQSQKA